jgi:hypothetical protein
VVGRNNPLLAAYWARQFRLRRLHRSSLFWSALAVAGITAVLLTAALKGNEETLWWALGIYALALLPVTSCVPLWNVSHALARLRRRQHLEALFVTPLSDRSLTWGVLVPAALPLLLSAPLTMLGVFSSIVLFSMPVGRGNIIANSEMLHTLMGSGAYAVIQILFTAAVTLHVALRTPSFAHTLMRSSLLLAIPFVLGVLLSVADALSDVYALLSFIAWLMLFKLVTSIALVQHMGGSFRRLCRIGSG